MAKFSCSVLTQLVEKPEANIDDLFFKELNDEGVKFMANVSVYNPNYIPIPISEISFSLKFDSGKKVATGRMTDPRSLKGKKKTILEVPVQVKYNIFGELVKDILADWEIDCHLDLDLIIDLPVIRNITIHLHFDREIKLKTQTLSQIWLRRSRKWVKSVSALLQQ